MQSTVETDLVLLGAGHAHVAVLRTFGMTPLPGVRLTLITRQIATPYSGMLPGLIAGIYGVDDAHIDTGPLARFARARLLHDEAVGLDPVAGRVLCRDRPPVPYDVLSINIGSTPDVRSVAGAAEHAIPVKPIDGFLQRFDAMQARVVARKGGRIVLVGGGAGGVELMLSIERRLRSRLGGAAALSFVLIESAPDILPTFPVRMRRRFRAVCAERGIVVMTASKVTRVEAGAVHLESGLSIPADEILWTTQASAPSWLETTGLALDPHGFVSIEATGRSVSHENVFAAGDIAAIAGYALPKSGVYAVREGPVLAANIRRHLRGRALVRYRPQREALYLITTGDKFAVGTRNGLVFGGPWVWRLKDRIDRRFMRRFNELPEMSGAAPSHARTGAARPRASAAPTMRCGGCGGKIGAHVLARSLHTLSPLRREEVVLGMDAAEDAAIVDLGGPQLALHTVDFFRAMIDDPYLFGKIAATHALGDVYAMGGTPQTALAIVTLPYAPDAKVEADLSAMMTGANEVLGASGCALVGGHTSEGAELALGFAVNGLVPRGRIVRKSGLVPGDALILTKAIGTGALLAADMRARAKGRWVAAALAQMCVSNAAAAAILARHGLHAATDVTGFGLLGHLVEMAQASGVDAALALGRIPVLEGARETLAAGIASSMQPQNERYAVAIADRRRTDGRADDRLLFDPQTSGGLLAGVPGAAAEACVGDLHMAGYPAAAIVGAVRSRGRSPERIEIVADDLAFAFAPRIPAAANG